MLNSILLAILVIEIGYYIYIGVENGKKIFPKEQEMRELQKKALEEDIKSKVIAQQMSISQSKYMELALKDAEKNTIEK